MLEEIAQSADVETGVRLATLSDSHMAVWSDDGRLLAVASPGLLPEAGYGTDRSFVKVWEVTPPVPSCRLGKSIAALSFARDGRQLAVDGQVMDVVPQRDQAFLKPAQKWKGAEAAVFLGNGSLWACDLPRLQNKGVSPFKLRQTGPAERELSLSGPGKVYSWVISPDGRFLAINPDISSVVRQLILRDGPTRGSNWVYHDPTTPTRGPPP